MKAPLSTHQSPRKAMVYIVGLVLLSPIAPLSTMLSLCTTATPSPHKSIYHKTMYQTKCTDDRQSFALLIAEGWKRLCVLLFFLIIIVLLIMFRISIV